MSKIITVYRFNFLIRFSILFLTPVFFTYFNFAFIWHSIYYGCITIIILIWGVFVFLTPLFGRIGCGWFCPFGTVQDLIGDKSITEVKLKKPLNVVRFTLIGSFFISAFVLFFIRLSNGEITAIQFDPLKLEPIFDGENSIIWIADTIGILLITFFLGKRGLCRNICFLGGLCSIGSKHSRLLLVVDKDLCNDCGRCTKECLGKVDIENYIDNENGLIMDSECLKCGKCIEVCPKDAISYKFVWNRKKYQNELNCISQECNNKDCKNQNCNS